MDKKDPGQALLERLDRWLVAQPEYPLLFLQDRATRRQIAHLLAKHFATLPTREDHDVPNRKTRRAIIRELRGRGPLPRHDRHDREDVPPPNEARKR